MRATADRLADLPAREDGPGRSSVAGQPMPRGTVMNAKYSRRGGAAGRPCADAVLPERPDDRDDEAVIDEHTDAVRRLFPARQRRVDFDADVLPRTGRPRPRGDDRRAGLWRCGRASGVRDRAPAVAAHLLRSGRSPDPEIGCARGRGRARAALDGTSSTSTRRSARTRSASSCPGSPAGRRSRATTRISRNTSPTTYRGFRRRRCGFCVRRFSRKLCEGVDHLIVPTAEMAEVLRGYGIRTPSTVVPTGIRLDEFAHGDGARFRRTHGDRRDAADAAHGEPPRDREEHRLSARSRRARSGASSTISCSWSPGEGPDAPRLKRADRIARSRRARALSRQSRSQHDAARLLQRGRRLHVRLEHRDAGPRADRSDGVRCADRLDGRDGYRDRAARCAERTRSARATSMRSPRTSRDCCDHRPSARRCRRRARTTPRNGARPR